MSTITGGVPIRKKLSGSAAWVNVQGNAEPLGAGEYRLELGRVQKLAFNGATACRGQCGGAARRLGLSASAMSRTLARLRAATGDRLLVRAGRGMVPTPHATDLRNRVHELTQGVQAVLRPVVTGLDLNQLKRSFIIRSNDGFVEVFAAQLVAAVTAAAPIRRESSARSRLTSGETLRIRSTISL